MSGTGTGSFWIPWTAQKGMKPSHGTTVPCNITNIPFAILRKLTLFTEYPISPISNI